MARKRNTEELRRYWTVDPRPAGKFHTFQEAKAAWAKAGYPNRGGYAGISETAVKSGIPRVVRTIPVLDDQTEASTMAIANPSSDRADIIQAMARAFYGRAWADREEEMGRSLGGVEIFDVMPTVWDPSALKAAKKLASAMEKLNGKKLPALLALAETLAAKDRYAQPATAENFGHYAAMQAMGAGDGLEELGVRNQIKVPDIEYSYYEFKDEPEGNPEVGGAMLTYDQVFDVIYDDLFDNYSEAPVVHRIEVALVRHNIHLSDDDIWVLRDMYFSEPPSARRARRKKAMNPAQVIVMRDPDELMDYVGEICKSPSRRDEAFRTLPRGSVGCEICGRAIKNYDKATIVKFERLDGNVPYAPTPIGPDCAKKLVKMMESPPW